MDDQPDDVDMCAKDASLYRAITARINFLAQDRSDLQFSSKECSRRMSSPKVKDWQLLKRIGRYLAGRPRAVSTFKWQDPVSSITAYADSDWAGCRDTRKSTSGACFLLGSHLIKSYSKTQSNLALSSAEAELYSFVTAASESIGLKSMLRDFGVEAEAFLNVDASAAIGIAERKGHGKVRHLDCQALWIQDAVRQRRIHLEKVLGTENPADLFTKHLDQKPMNKCLGKLGITLPEGRAKTAPRAQGSKAQGNDVQEVQVNREYESQVKKCDKSKAVRFQEPKKIAEVIEFEKGKRLFDCWADEGDDEPIEPIQIDSLEIDISPEVSIYEPYEPNTEGVSVTVEGSTTAGGTWSRGATFRSRMKGDVIRGEAAVEQPMERERHSKARRGEATAIAFPRQVLFSDGCCSCGLPATRSCWTEPTCESGIGCPMKRLASCKGRYRSLHTFRFVFKQCSVRQCARTCTRNCTCSRMRFVCVCAHMHALEGVFNQCMCAVLVRTRAGIAMLPRTRVRSARPRRDAWPFGSSRLSSIKRHTTPKQAV